MLYKNEKQNSNAGPTTASSVRRLIGAKVPCGNHHRGQLLPTPVPKGSALKSSASKVSGGSKGGSAKRSAPARASGRPDKRVRPTPKKVVRITSDGREEDELTFNGSEAGEDLE
ncbi:hypothetical protein VD0002_g5880 [Verticillium dahliae]|uniref:Uncharacterized protein n=2 Tax=Verticillium dahliae TaxID=27337 RepID=G2X3X9_VERDV|nr:uncharacterized protein VDAG_04716 [Verticillium dahliae VdLs.17]KAF3346040.1 Cellobiose dehydrogenase [Verticillium dahliae VDG2]PNH27464.1 hypothetical protein BJF96_g9213 [Verticillium dahliae]EGY23278.1 hypothetical protein VDAG_04716 [Verticillium dahliae VdLs.17]PNH57043.1 hypothetical protein VD0003_g743 [Verticillium dahliae]PNH62080.1 hypothetical protein VD0002_g5880 [Verticillium dahliae]